MSATVSQFLIRPPGSAKVRRKNSDLFLFGHKQILLNTRSSTSTYSSHRWLYFISWCIFQLYCAHYHIFVWWYPVAALLLSKWQTHLVVVFVDVLVQLVQRDQVIQLSRVVLKHKACRSGVNLCVCILSLSTLWALRCGCAHPGQFSQSRVHLLVAGWNGLPDVSIIPAIMAITINFTGMNEIKNCINKKNTDILKNESFYKCFDPFVTYLLYYRAMNIRFYSKMHIRCEILSRHLF